MNNINLKIYKPDEDALPFVEIKFNGKDSKLYSALMLLDSGSTGNSLMTEMREFMNDEDWLPKESDEVVTLTNEATKVSCGKFAFELDGKLFQEKFFFFENHHLMQYDGMMFVGVLGNRFMQEHHLAIDYANMSVHTSDTTLEELKNSNCDFVIPMDYGLKYYNVSTLHIHGKEHDAIVFADTGCDNFSISQNAIETCGLTHKFTDNIHFADGPDGSVEVKECSLVFGITEEANGGNKILHQVIADVLPHSLNVTEDGECDDDGNLLVPLEGMIGSPFMAKQKWILDFGIKAIYRHKMVLATKEPTDVH